MGVKMEQKKLIIEVNYYQGIPEWEKRLIDVKINGIETSHFKAVAALLAVSQAPVKKKEE